MHDYGWLCLPRGGGGNLNFVRLPAARNKLVAGDMLIRVMY